MVAIERDIAPGSNASGGSVGARVDAIGVRWHVGPDAQASLVLSDAGGDEAGALSGGVPMRTAAAAGRPRRPSMGVRRMA